MRIKIVMVIPENVVSREPDEPNTHSGFLLSEAHHMAAERMVKLRGNAPYEIHTQFSKNIKNLTYRRV
jgi:hypothetical protein